MNKIQAALEYAFDVQLIAAIRVKAASREQAETMLRELLDCAETNFGAWPDGSPAIGETSIPAHVGPYLFEVDGEDVE